MAHSRTRTVLRFLGVGFLRGKNSYKYLEEFTLKRGKKNAHLRALNLCFRLVLSRAAERETRIPTLAFFVVLVIVMLRFYHIEVTLNVLNASQISKTYQ